MATKTKKDPHEGEKRYIANKRIGSNDGSEVWNPGAEIWMNDAQAARHLIKGNIRPADETAAPQVVETAVVHEATEVTNGDANSTATD